MEEDLGKSEQALVAARREHLAALRSRGRDPFAQTRYDVDATVRKIRRLKELDNFLGDRLREGR